MYYLYCALFSYLTKKKINSLYCILFYFCIHWSGELIGSYCVKSNVSKVEHFALQMAQTLSIPCNSPCSYNGKLGRVDVIMGRVGITTGRAGIITGRGGGGVGLITGWVNVITGRVGVLRQGWALQRDGSV